MKTTNGTWKRWMALGMVAVLMAPVAMAGPGESRGRGEAGVRASAPRMSAPSVSRDSSRDVGNRGNNRGYDRGRDGGGNAGRYPILEALRDSRYNDNRYNDRYDRHGRHNDDMADAVKAAAIANAVVGVVGILANAGQPHCPPPVVVAPVPPPRGHYVTERVLVQPGYYEQVRAWVPQSRDPYTGCIVGGYYEVQNRWVPDVYELRQVWVAH